MNTFTPSRGVAVASALGILMAAALTGCSGSSNAATPAASTGRIVIGHSYQDLTNQFFSDELAAEQALGKESGVDIIDTQAGGNPAKQLDDINTLIARGVDVLAIDAIDPDAIVPALNAAEQAGIPVISLIRTPTSGKYESLIYLDSVKDGEAACTYIAEKLGGKGRVINLTGPLQILAAKERAAGCDQALAKYPGIQVVARPNTDYSLRDAEQKMTDAIQANGEVDAVFGGNDDVALGAIRAMTSAGQDPSKKIVVGVDGTASALTAICDGTMSQTMATFPKAEAKLVVDTAKAIVSGGGSTAKVLFPAVAVNAGNLREMAATAGVQLGDCKVAQ